MHSVKITFTGPGRGKVEVDGLEILGVTRILVAAGVGRTNRVRLDLITDQLEIMAADAEVAKKYVQKPQP